MTTTAKLLEERRIINAYDALRLATGRVFDNQLVVVTYHAPPPGRLGWTKIKHTTVWSTKKLLGMERPKGEGWGAYVREFSGERRVSLPAAAAWVKATFGYDVVPVPLRVRGYYGSPALVAFLKEYAKTPLPVASAEVKQAQR